MLNIALVQWNAGPGQEWCKGVENPRHPWHFHRCTKRQNRRVLPPRSTCDDGLFRSEPRLFAGATFIFDAFETDWLAGAAGFEPLHIESEFAKTLSPRGRTRTCASRIKDARAALLTKASGARSTPRSCSGGMKFSRNGVCRQNISDARFNPAEVMVPCG